MYSVLRSPLVALLAVGAAGALSLSACGSDPASTAAAGTTTKAVTAADGASTVSTASPMESMGSMMQVESEFEFLTEMIPHHQEAVEAATALRTRTARPELQGLADAIVSSQSAEITQMNGWLASWYPGKPTDLEYRPMMRDTTTLTGDAYDKAFIDDMLMHHMMAVQMSQSALKLKDLRAEVRTLATAIVGAQTTEIKQMNSWRAEWYGAASPSDGMDGMDGMDGLDHGTTVPAS